MEAAELWVGFVGAGRMAGGLVRGLLQAGKVPASNVLASAPSDKNLDAWRELGCRTTHCNLEVVHRSTLVFLATKPHVLPGVLEEIRPAVGPNHIVVSLVAGVTIQTLQRQGHARTPLLALQLLDFCLSILTLCSSYMEVPTYLSLKPVDNGGSLPALEKLPAEEYAKVMITFTIAFVAVLILKAYMFKCVLSCFKFIKASRRDEEKVEPHAVEKAVLPSYEEALELPSKDCPPPYVTI